MASSSVAGFPSTSASGYRRSAVWCLNQDSPRLQAFLALTMRSPSACSSMSSQTQPQKVHVASFTTVRLILLSLGLAPARTGRNDERSTKLPAGEAPPDAARHVPPGLNHFPRRNVFRRRFLVEHPERPDLFVWQNSLVHIAHEMIAAVAVSGAIGSTSTSQPLDVGIPVPSVYRPMR